VWREAPFFSECERTALRWAEILNNQSHGDASGTEEVVQDAWLCRQAADHAGL
jgi:hypothetical protein